MTSGLVEILRDATLALAEVHVDDGSGAQIDGISALANFLQRMVTVDPSVRQWGGGTTSKTRLCVEEGGACRAGRGRIISELTPLHLVSDALGSIDDAFADDPDRLAAWHQGRSGLVDQLLEVDRSGVAGSYRYQLRDRTGYRILHPALQWLLARFDAHRQAGDLEAWADGLSERLAKVLRHPITAGTVDLLDAFWPEAEASGEFTALSAYLTNEENTSAYTGTLTALADTLLLLDRDPNLSPAIQFAALGLAPNAFRAIRGEQPPRADQGVTYAALELTGGVVATLNDAKKNKFKRPGQPTALSKLLGNAVLAPPGERSVLEVLLDVVADVNRENEDADPLQFLSADEDRDVFSDVKKFLRDDSQDQRSMERLYQVIQHRNVK
jgi:hypothetical protein